MTGRRSHPGRTRGFIVFQIDGAEVKHREYLLNTFTGHANIVDEMDPDQAVELYLVDALENHPDKGCDHRPGNHHD